MPEFVEKWTSEQEQWILDNQDICETTKLYKYFNDEFGTNRSSESVRARFKRLGCRSPLTWTEEEDIWLKDNFHKLGAINAYKQLDIIFKKNRGLPAVTARARKLKLYADPETIENNKNYSRRVRLGSIREDTDGYLRIKINDGSTASGWVSLSRYILENHYGPIPEGYSIFFLDGNKRNLRIENLIIVPKEFHAIMNKLGWNKDDRDIAKAGLAWCALNKEIRERSKDNGKTGITE